METAPTRTPLEVYVWSTWQTTSLIETPTASVLGGLTASSCLPRVLYGERPGQGPLRLSRRAGREPSEILVFFQGSSEWLGRRQS